MCQVSGVHQRDDSDAWKIRKISFQNFPSDECGSVDLMDVALGEALGMSSTPGFA